VSTPLQPPPGPTRPYLVYPAPPIRRPIGVTILAVRVVIFGVIALLFGLMLILAGALVGAAGLGPFAGFVLIFGGSLILLGLLWIVAGVGLLRLRTWEWWLAVIASVLLILCGIAALPATGLSVGVAIIILVYLIAVRGSFGRSP